MDFGSNTTELYFLYIYSGKALERKTETKAENITSFSKFPMNHGRVEVRSDRML